MQFYFILILLHRPFLQFPRVLHDLNSTHAATNTSTETCALAASNITKLMLDFQSTHSIRQVPSPVTHFAYIAGTIHLVNFRLTKMNYHGRYLQSCMASLRELRHSYPIARTALTVLEELVERWQPSTENSRPISGNPFPTGEATANHTDLDWMNTDNLSTMDMPPLPEMDTASLHDPRPMSMANIDVDMFGAMGHNNIYDGRYPVFGSELDSFTDRDIFNTFYGSTFTFD